MADKIYDVIIIGGGPAGLSAAIYTSREQMSTIVLEKAMCGGWLSYTPKIENFPGFPAGISGIELAGRFKEQAQKFGAQIMESADVTGVKLLEGVIAVETNTKIYNAKAVIISTGTMAMKLNIPGEKEFTGKGVSYCATCDGPLFKNKTIVVVGGNNVACEEALFLSKFAKYIILIHKKSKLDAAKVLCEDIEKNEKIKVLTDHIVTSINGDKLVHSVDIEDIKAKQRSRIEAQGVFILHVGFQANTQPFKGILELDDKGFIKTDDKMKTSKPGIFAAGDIRSKRDRQVSVAAAEGVIAALSVRDYLKKA